MTVELMLGDCLDIMATLPDNSVDTIITDPPYGLEFMGKDWDKGVPGIHFWSEMLRIAKPGATLMAMGGTRTYHRLASAIEDAGFEIRDTIAWVYGSGFPKSYDISKGMDKHFEAEREVVGYKKLNERDKKVYAPKSENGAYNPRTTQGLHNNAITAPVTPEAQQWDGWGTALKPAMELICVAMKPIDGTFVNNALTWGVAGLWIDGGRVETDDDLSGGTYGGTFGASRDENGNLPKAIGSGDKGRFPANVIHDGSDEVTGLFPETKSGSINGTYNNTIMAQSFGNRDGKAIHLQYNGDSGSAARFFYCAKASRSERNAGLEGMEERGDSYKMRNSNGESDGWGNKFETKPMQNHHPTVKPLALMRYLARLTKTPTGGVVLDPFMGSGTTGMAAVMEGRDFIGIEQDAEYMEIARRRIEYWQKQVQPRLL